MTNNTKQRINRLISEALMENANEIEKLEKSLKSLYDKQDKLHASIAKKIGNNPDTWSINYETAISGDYFKKRGVENEAKQMVSLIRQSSDISEKLANLKSQNK